MNTFYKSLVGLLTVLLVITVLLTNMAVAQDEPATLPETGAAANHAGEYITQLDELRALGIAATFELAHPEVYEFSSDLQSLNAEAFRQANRAKIDTAVNEYITRLDELRSMQNQ